MTYNYYLYRHIRLDKQEPFYIGVGTKPCRFTCHKMEFSRAYQGGKYRGKIWNDIVAKTEYEVEIMFETGDYSLLLQKELEFISMYGRICNQTGILSNLSEGGASNARGIIWSDESRKKLSLAKTGSKMSQDCIRRRVESRRMNYVYTDEHKRKLSESNKRHPKHQKGKVLSEETKNKIRVSAIKRLNKTHSL